MADRPYFKSSELGRDFNPDAGELPTISTGLNAVRTYSFEIDFNLPPGIVEGAGDTLLTLAAKQVTSVGMSSEPIEVHRVNDRVYYPGKVSREVMTVTFDNIYQKKVANTLFNWFQSIYNPLTGEMMENLTTNLGVEPRGVFKAKDAKIYHLDPKGNPLMTTKLLGVWPTKWSTSEFNYSTNEFHTITVDLSYDFIDHSSSRPARAR
jgi:hypothetical protein